MGTAAAAADLDGFRDTGSRRRVLPGQGRQQATATAQAGNGSAEGHLDVQFMAATRARSPYLGGDHALGVKCLHLKLATLIEVKGLSGPHFVGGVLIGYFGNWCTGGIIHFLRYPLVGQTFPNYDDGID